ADELMLVRTTELGSVADNNTASNVCEPSVAINRDVVFYTGNWFAAVSVDGGVNFRYINPFTAFPDPPGMSFCCDQVVHYIRRIDTFVWLLQYSPNQNGGNIQRLAFATTEEVRQGRWRLFDITPEALGLANNLFLDFPDIAISSNMLYVTTNVFADQNWSATAIVRLPLADIQSGQITAQSSISTENFNFRVAQHCSTRAFWASHNNTSQIRIFSWSERDAQPSFVDMDVPRWARGAYRSMTPDNFNWLGRADPRMTGATKAGRELWFAWGSNQGGTNNRPHPFVQIARVDANSFNLLGSINLWDPNAAVCYAALSTNSKREVGVSYMIGGGGRFPSHMVGMLTGTRRDVVVVEGTRGPSNQKCGDYLTVRRNYPNMKLFAATGFTLQQGVGVTDASPHFVIFGRASEV
ncbi:MAG: hypothetical protein HYR94_01475, partial [Chloroflexi bacterium]|nr:hypothetical protein [Chloroflexota bacterium]